MAELTNHVLYKFDGRGKCVQCLEALGAAMLKGWALMNTSGKAKTIIMEEDTQNIIMVVLGKGKDFPKVITDAAEIAKMEIAIE
jgi:hypothetical protein